MRSFVAVSITVLLVLGMTTLATPRELTERLLSANAVVTNGTALCAGTFLSPVTVLTAHHCIQGAKALTVYSRTGHSGIASIEQDSEGWDLALLHLRSAIPGAMPSGNAVAEAAVGDEIWVIGNPTGESFVAFHGYVAKVIPRFKFENCDHDPTGGKVHDALFLDSRTFPGNSGGGVYDNSGHLVGVLVGAALNSECGSKVEGETLWAIAVGPHTVSSFLGGQS